MGGLARVPRADADGRVENDAARRAYEAVGFTVCGETTWMRDGRTLDEFVMVRSL